MSGAGGEPLSAVFARLIAAAGPISVAQYMAESNARYYASRDPLGAAGDFVTAPEISQMFGELIGVWLADLWQRAGRAEPVHYVELGPGHGTLAGDALGAAERFGLRPLVHFVEASPALRARQRELHPEAHRHDDLSTLPSAGPLLVVANEFLDALPVRQLVRTGEGWRERMVGLVEEDGGERLAFVAGSQPLDDALPAEIRDAPTGTIVETCPAAAAIAGEVAERLAMQGGAALLIDYGHVSPRTGSTLQAVRGHRKVDPLAAAGEADLTAHVDFAALAAVAEMRGARWLGTVGQGEFLRALGIDARAERLAASARDQAVAILRGRDRLTGDDEMGALFKVMGLADRRWPGAAGF
ncbi:MAG: SAM-dependent methyltransferase [Novosphingobium sp.]|nr:SAM-dependent methyltransferase [Novosphingobium sp.]